MAKRLRYYDNDKKYIPMTHTDFVRFGSRWKVINEEKSLISRIRRKTFCPNRDCLLKGHIVWKNVTGGDTMNLFTLFHLFRPTEEISVPFK